MTPWLSWREICRNSMAADDSMHEAGTSDIGIHQWENSTRGDVHIPNGRQVKGHWKHRFGWWNHLFLWGFPEKKISQRIHAYARFHTCCNPDLPSDTAVRFTSSVRVGFPTWLVQESFGSDIRSDLNSNPQNADVYGPHTALPLILFQGAECNGLDGLQNETHWTTMNLVRRCHKCTENCSCL